MRTVRALPAAFVLVAAAWSFDAVGQTPEPLVLEAKIPLGDVKGRIDHLAFDPARKRLFVAELGNDTVGVVDIEARRVVHVISGLKGPQGTGYVAADDTVYVANAGEGSVRIYRATDYGEVGRIDVGKDADNLLVDAAGQRVFVGFGEGALAVIDPVSRRMVAHIPLGAHPEGFQFAGARRAEGFQLAAAAGRIFVNLPRLRQIAVVDPAAESRTATWPMKAADNFPMTLDEAAQRVIVAFRRPPLLGVFSMRDGASVAELETCGDADDLFMDPRRHRVYVVCGEGFVDVFEARPDA